MKIGKRSIGPTYPPFIIAEMSGNHNGDKSRALELVKLAAEAGVDAIKLQTYTADTLTLNCSNPDFLISDGPWKGRSLYQLYEEAHTPWEWHAEIFKCAQDNGLLFFSSPFDSTAVDFLETLKVPAYKIASFEIVDIPLIRKAAATGKPLIISTGLANQSEIRCAFEAAKGAGASQVILLHCVSAYPAQPENYNLRTLKFLAEEYDALIGLSDHTLGSVTAISAISHGAVVVEKHLTLKRSDGGPDSKFSLEPDEFHKLVEDCHTAWKAQGTVRTDPIKAEMSNVQFRRSLYVVKNIRQGELFTHENIRSIRPGFGLPPVELDNIIGQKSCHDLDFGKPLDWVDVEK
jgi:pseudaminic acid synthase